MDYSKISNLFKNSKLDLNSEDEPLDKAYQSYITTPSTVKPEPQVTDLYTAPAAAYKQAGGGWKGAGIATLAGLGKLGELISTKTGQQIMAGTSSDPYLKMAYVQGAENAGNRAVNESMLARQENIEKMKMAGEKLKGNATNKTELQKGREAGILDIIKAEQARQAELPFKQAALANQQKELELKTQEFTRKPVEEQRKSIIDAAQEAYKKGSISAEALNEIVQNPDTKQIVNRGFWAHLIPFVKTSTVENKPSPRYTLTPVAG